MDSDLRNSCDIFCEMLLSYNKTHNITGARDKAHVFENIEDSLFPLRFLPFLPLSAIDIGSGAGFPAMFLAIALPKCSFILYEPKPKKSAFLHMAKCELKLDNVEIKSKRIEEDKPFVVDMITSRAVGKVKFLIQLSKGFYNKNTMMLLYKGERARDEIEGLNAQIFSRKKRQYVLLRGLDG
ncbi:MAG: 16S rRNA (guanine(527)-N(7))-methyltransferase RsmG [Campylobacteraceae bacterium]|jgi:16S rRNA (guanine527-N7)-methyltransferase|nr:16S rRNA (guanine(527)-N(7))-methyltransferase RsmG [Campylobacteraceae bacterium]